LKHTKTIHSNTCSDTCSKTHQKKKATVLGNAKIGFRNKVKLLNAHSKPKNFKAGGFWGLLFVVVVFFYLLEVGDDQAAFVSVRMKLFEEGIHLFTSGHATGTSRNVSHQASKLLRSSFLMGLLLPSQVNHFLVVFDENVVRHYGHPVGAQKKRP